MHLIFFLMEIYYFFLLWCIDLCTIFEYKLLYIDLIRKITYLSIYIENNTYKMSPKKERLVKSKHKILKKKLFSIFEIAMPLCRSPLIFESNPAPL